MNRDTSLTNVSQEQDLSLHEAILNPSGSSTKLDTVNILNRILKFFKLL